MCVHIKFAQRTFTRVLQNIPPAPVTLGMLKRPHHHPRSLGGHIPLCMGGGRERDGKREGRRGEGARYEAHTTYAAALEFVTQVTRIRADDKVLIVGIAGSATKQQYASEKLSEQRLEAVRKCIRGECGHPFSAGNTTLCRAGCGRSLHIASCAGMGKGFAALGNFRCVDCRLIDLVEIPDEAS